LGLTGGADLQVLAVEFVKARVPQAQFGGSGFSGELASTMVGQQVTDERSGQTFY
jgi:hypothetical protein